MAVELRGRLLPELLSPIPCRKIAGEARSRFPPVRAGGDSGANEAVFQDSGSDQGEEQAVENRVPGLVAGLDFPDGFFLHFLFLIVHDSDGRLGLMSAASAGEEAEEEKAGCRRRRRRWRDPAAAAVQPLSRPEDPAVACRSVGCQNALQCVRGPVQVGPVAARVPARL